MLGSLNEELNRLATEIDNLQLRPDLVVAKKAHKRDASETEKQPILWWKTACGWPYGHSHFFRLEEAGDIPLCKKSFPSPINADHDDVSVSESESSGSATSSAPSSSEAE